ncbi:MAG: FHA domain-containing protein [Planctomycetes bacterium]|nr:FHA domain-containing protein [Planctomycetota bacterium]
MASYTITVKHLSGSRRGTTEAFVQLPLRIGRAESCQLQFDPDLDLKVSAEHAEIRCSDEGVLEVVDLDSTNGVLLDGAKLDGPTPLPDRGTLEIGGGGPRVQITYEEGGGFSLKRAKAAQSAGSGRKLAATDSSFPVLKREELEEEDASPIAGLPPQALAAIAAGGAIVLAALGWWLLS